MASWFSKKKDTPVEEKPLSTSYAGDVFAKRDTQVPEEDNELTERILHRGGYGNVVSSSGNVVTSAPEPSGPQSVAELLAEKKKLLEKQGSGEGNGEATANRFINEQRNETLYKQVAGKKEKKLTAAESAAVDASLGRITEGLKNKGLLTKVESSSDTAKVTKQELDRVAQITEHFKNKELLTEVKSSSPAPKTMTTQEEIAELEMISKIVAGRVKPAVSGATDNNEGEGK